MEDKKPGEAASWKFVEKEILIKELEAKQAAKLAKEAEKIARQELELKKKSTPGSEWFKTFRADEFSKFDENGLPTHNNKDKELSEAIRNKLKKDQAKQQSIYEKWLSEKGEESKE